MSRALVPCNATQFRALTQQRHSARTKQALRDSQDGFLGRVGHACPVLAFRRVRGPSTRACAQRTIAELAGLRVATAHPGTTGRWFAGQGIDVTVIPLSGAVEVAPRLGLAEAIVDLQKKVAELLGMPLPDPNGTP